MKTDRQGKQIDGSRPMQKQNASKLTHNYLRRSSDFRSQELAGLLRRSARAMRWAIVDRKPEKAARHARIAARYGRLLIERRAQLAGVN